MFFLSSLKRYCGLVSGGLFLLCCSSNLVACTTNKQGHSGADTSSSTQETSLPSSPQAVRESSGEEPPFALPTPPAMLQDPMERATYFLEHFWDNCDFMNGDKYLDNRGGLEQAFVDFLGVSAALPLEVALPLFLVPLERAQGKLFDYFVKEYKHYLFEPNSPMYNESLYREVLKWLSESPKPDLATKENAKFAFHLIERNQPGKYAEEFSFTIAGGEQVRLSSYRGKPTILYFFTPGCHSCETTTEKLKADKTIRTAIESGTARLLYICAECSGDRPERLASFAPDFAIVGIDSEGKILSTPLYDLKASPTIYILDAQGKVVAKDTRLEDIAQYLAP